MAGRTTQPDLAPPRRGAGALSSSAAGPTAAARMIRRYRFVIADSYRRDVSSKRRAAVAEYVAGWMDGMIVRDQRVGADTIIAVAVARPVCVEIAEAYIQECPHYVAGTFAVVR
jgi:hypothetical protein